MVERSYKLTVEQDGEGYVASVPSIPGVKRHGETIESAREAAIHFAHEMFADMVYEDEPLEDSDPDPDILVSAPETG